MEENGRPANMCISKEVRVKRGRRTSEGGAKNAKRIVTGNE